jgi:hypothetical protein
MQLVLSEFGAPIDRIEDNLGNDGLPEEGGTAASFIQQAIHGQKSFTRTDASGRKWAIGWKTISQTERDKLRLADYVHMGKPPAGHGHTWLAEDRRKILTTEAAWEAAAGRGPAPRKLPLLPPN